MAYMRPTKSTPPPKYPQQAPQPAIAPLTPPNLSVDLMTLPGSKRPTTSNRMRKFWATTIPHGQTSPRPISALGAAGAWYRSIGFV